MEFENKPILYVQEDGSDHMIGSTLSKFSSVHEKVRQPMDIYIRVNTGQIKSYFDGVTPKDLHHFKINEFELLVIL